VEVALEQRLGHGQDLAAQDDDGRRAVTHLLVLRTRQLNHALGRRVAHVHLAKDAVAVVGHDDAAHRIQQHFEHRPRPQRRPNDVGDGLGGLNVVHLRNLARLALRVGV
jgi:hypothetical protein